MPTKQANVFKSAVDLPANSKLAKLIRIYDDTTFFVLFTVCVSSQSKWIQKIKQKRIQCKIDQGFQVKDE